MKSVSNVLANYLNNTRNFQSCDLYELQLANGNKYYFNNTDIDVVFDGKTYLHNVLLLKRQKTKINERVVVDSMTITINANASTLLEGKPIFLAAHDGVLDMAKLYLRRCFFKDGAVVDVINLFGGNVEVKKCGGIKLEVVVKAKTQGLAQEFPIRKYYPQGTYSTVGNSVSANTGDDASCLITPFVPQKEALL